jgi:MerR-like DNA binding protein
VGGAALATSADVSSVLRDLAGTVTEVVEVLDRNPSHVLETASPALLRELATRVGVLNHLLERAVEPLPPRLTLQAVSRRTGVPAATLRTWERRYGFVRPPRSASGYRLYGQEELRAILHVKHLREQGVRISEAMATVTRER